MAHARFNLRDLGIFPCTPAHSSVGHNPGGWRNKITERDAAAQFIWKELERKGWTLLPVTFKCITVGTDTKMLPVGTTTGEEEGGEAVYLFLNDIL